MIISDEEKLGWLKFTLNEAIDLVSFISSNALSEVPFHAAYILGGMDGLRKLVYLKDWIGFW